MDNNTRKNTRIWIGIGLVLAVAAGLVFSLPLILSPASSDSQVLPASESRVPQQPTEITTPADTTRNDTIQDVEKEETIENVELVEPFVMNSQQTTQTNSVPRKFEQAQEPVDTLSAPSEEPLIDTGDETIYRDEEKVLLSYIPPTIQKPVDVQTNQSQDRPLLPRLVGFVDSMGIENGQVNVSVTQSFQLQFASPPQPAIVEALEFDPPADFTSRLDGNLLTVQPTRLRRDTTYIFGANFEVFCHFDTVCNVDGVHNVSLSYGISFRTNWYEKYVYGTSVQGRPLESYIFGNADESGKTIMLTGGIHGNEWRSGDLTQLVQYLSQNPQEIAGQNKKIVIVPFANPDGTALNQVDNANGVNLNRNWPAYWSPCPRCGPTAYSEPETWYLGNFTQAEGVDWLISYHAQWPPNGIIFLGNDFHPDTNWFARWVADRTGYPVGIYPGGVIVPGDQTVWAEAAGIRALIVEATYRSNSDWEKNFPMYLDLFRSF